MLMRSTFLILTLLVAVLLPNVAAAQTGLYAVQLEALTSLDGARQRVGELRSLDIPAYFVIGEVAGKGRFFRVRVGRFGSRAEARRYGDDLIARGAASSYFITGWEPPVAAVPAAEKSAAEEKPRPVASPVPPPPPPPSPAATVAPTSPVTPKAAPEAPKQVPATVAYHRFEDPAIGYSFEVPVSWEEGHLSREKPGRVFRSVRDSAFLNVIWNKVERTNSPETGDDLLVDIILRGMNAGKGTRQVVETSRRVVADGPLRKIFLDLDASFDMPGSETPGNFAGRSLIVRGDDGILLVAVFYHQSVAASVAATATRIVESFRPLARVSSSVGQK